MKVLTTSPFRTESEALCGVDGVQVGMGRLRILHVLNRVGVGGTEHGAMKIISGLADDEFEHAICATRGIDPSFSAVRNGGQRVFVAGDIKANFQFLILRLIRIFRAYKPHVVHSRNWGAIEAIPAARLAGVPVVVHSEHGYEVQTITGLPRRQRLLRRALYPFADAVFTVTEELRQYHARQAWVDPSTLGVICNGVDTRRFSPGPETRASIRATLGIPDHKLLIGSVGRMVAIKDYSTLFRAADRLCQRGIDLHVIMVGCGPELGRYHEEVSQMPALAGRVTFCGDRDDVSDLLKAMDVFVLTSLSEGMSNTLLEAMSTGLPVIATRVGGNPALIPNERYGLMFNPGATEELCDHLAELAAGPAWRQELGQAARQRALARFDLKRMLNSYRDLYVALGRKRGIGRSDLM